MINKWSAVFIVFSVCVTNECVYISTSFFVIVLMQLIDAEV